MAGHRLVERLLQAAGVEGDLQAEAGQVDQVIRAVLAVEDQPGQGARQWKGVLDSSGEAGAVLRGQGEAGGRSARLRGAVDGRPGEAAEGGMAEQLLEGEEHPP